jgi:hypothetical protein
MNLVSLLPDEKRKAVNNWLLGVTMGSYCFGAAFVSFGQVHFGRDPLLFVVPGLFVGLLDFVQIHSLRLVKRAPHERTTRFALWLNTIAIVGVCGLLVLRSALQGRTLSSSANLALAAPLATAFLLGIVVSVSNILWTLIAAKAKIAFGVALVVCLLPFMWPAYRAGIFTKDAGRYATRENRTILLHPSEVSFQIPQDWLDWNSEFHNNLHLTHRELERVQFASGEWDSEYSDVVNSALPFEDCAAHIGGEGWGREGASFADLQVRAYVTDLSSDEILKRISGSAFSTAKRVSSEVMREPAAQVNFMQDGQWQKAVVQYNLFYGDYGGRANVEFYVKQVGRHELVMVFMGKVEKEKQQILNSLTVPNPIKPRELSPKS